MTPSRRVFLGAVTAASYKRLLGANDRIQVGFIGYGLIGRQHVHDFKNQKDADLAAMCEVCQPRLEEGPAGCGPSAKPESEFPQIARRPRYLGGRSQALGHCQKDWIAPAQTGRPCEDPQSVNSCASAECPG
jgi:hypothetical protein